MDSNIPLFFVILFLCVVIFVSKKEGLDTRIDQEINFTVKNALITKIQLNCLVQSGDNWINLGDITIRDKNGTQINYGDTNNVYFGNKGNWGGLPVQNLWDNDKITMGHSSREVENLIINLNPVAVGSVQITNRQDCCWHRTANYELAVYNNTDKLGSVKLDSLSAQGKTIRYNLVYS